MKKTILNLAYRIKNSNLVFTFRANPFFWTYRFSFRKVASYADEWVYDPNISQYRFTLLFLSIDLIVDANTHNSKLENGDEFFF